MKELSRPLHLPMRSHPPCTLDLQSLAPRKRPRPETRVMTSPPAGHGFRSIKIFDWSRCTSGHCGALYAASVGHPPTRSPPYLHGRSSPSHPPTPITCGAHHQRLSMHARPCHDAPCAFSRRPY